MKKIKNLLKNFFGEELTSFLKSNFFFLRKKIQRLIVKFNYIFKRQYIYNFKNNINLETSSICNLNCIFCGYGKRDVSQHPKQIMSNETFKKNLDQILEYGFKYVGLTPTTGDIFMDKSIFEKFSIIENYSGFQGFYFYTNFIILDKKQIEKLLTLKKIKYLGISIYGHDLNSFLKISGSNKVSYLKLIENLNYLNDILNSNYLKNNFIISIEHRTVDSKDIMNHDNDLVSIIKKLIFKKNIKYEFQKNYDNWGGLIKKEDLNNVNINLKDKSTKKIGSCSLIYNRMTIGVDGTVNACACRDANFTLRIGNTNLNSLKEIISIRNKNYTNLISNQEKNNFSEVCRSCTFYSSIYQKENSSLAFSEYDKGSMSLKDYKSKISN